MKFPEATKLYLKKDGNIGAAQILKNSSNSKDYGTYISDYSNIYNTEMIIHDGTAKLVRTDTSGNAITRNVALDSDLAGEKQLKSKLYTGSAASGIVVTSRNNPISLENVSGQILAHVDSNQIGYISTCPTNPVTFTVVNGRVKMYVDNTFMGFITTTTT